MKLIVQPGDGIGPLINAIKQAKKSIEIVVFRFDEAAVERALGEAAQRGVFVHALIAFTNRGGERNLRKLEMRFLAKGITVARTANDLPRYHGKMMLVDRKELFLLAYNFTHLDIERSRSFGIVTRNKELVQEAARLFESDTKRQPYKPGSPRFVVSPMNARRELTAFLKRAKRELLIYDIKISDESIVRVLEERQRAGVEVKIMGRVSRSRELHAKPLRRMRLHARVIIRDRKLAFVGSQSLRKAELDARREIGIIAGGAKVVNSLVTIFEDDWKASRVPKIAREKPAAAPASKKIAKSVARKLPMAPVIKKVVSAIQKHAPANVDQREVKEAVEQSVKSALKKAIRKAASEVVDNAVAS